MPVYLVHGFRWMRDGFTGIRVHAIVHNLEDCSTEYIQNAHSRDDILKSFRKAFPDIMKHLEGPGRTLEFIEQYDPDDETCEEISQQYAFVGDRVVMIAGGAMAAEATRRQMGVNQSPSQKSEATSKRAHSRAGESGTSAGKGKADSSGKTSISSLNTPTSVTSLSMNVEEVIAQGPGLSAQAWEALADLRDKIAEGEKIGWWIVYNGDPVRAFTPYSDEEEDGDATIEEEDEGEDTETEEEYRRLKKQVSKTAIASKLAPPSTTPPATIVRKQSMPMRDKELPPAPPGTDKDSAPPLPTTNPPAAGSPPKQLLKSPASAKSPQTFVPRLSKAAPTNNTPHVTERENTKQEPGINTKPEAEPGIPEPSKLKDMAKTQGLRKKFFGRKA